MPTQAPNEWRTFGDPVLIAMEKHRVAFTMDMRTHCEPRWLSFCGASGTGKTFTAEKIYGSAVRMKKLQAHPTMRYGCGKLHFPTFIERLRRQEWHLFRNAVARNFLLLDEMAVTRDPTGFASDKLSDLLGARLGKWTVITSNLTLEAIGDIDGRISSRMIRGDNVVVKCDTLDYALRPKQ